MMVMMMMMMMGIQEGFGLFQADPNTPLLNPKSNPKPLTPKI